VTALPSVSPLAEMVRAIGTSDFGDSLHAAMRTIGGVDLSSAFLHEADGTTRMVHSGGHHERLSDFALRASLAYAREHWRSDRAIIRAARSASTRPLVMRIRSDAILNSRWRRACYDDTGVAERLSIVRPGDCALVIHGYRLSQNAGFTLHEIACMEDAAPLLLAALERDVNLQETPRDLPSEHDLTQSLASPPFGLSVREAQVASAMMLGRTQHEIAEARHLAHDTVVTYRRRAYEKLGVHNRRELAHLHRLILTAPDSHAG